MGTVAKNLELPPEITVGNTAYNTKELISAEEVQSRVGEMGRGLAERYEEHGEVHVLTVLSGAVHFASDLQRAMQSHRPGLQITSDYVQVASYSGTQSSGTVRFHSPPKFPLEGKHVLLAEDILDTGCTLSWLTNYLEHEKPASLEVAVAVSKDIPERTLALGSTAALHVGFEIPNEFVVGYGLDVNQQYRNLGSIYTLLPA